MRGCLNVHNKNLVNISKCNYSCNKKYLIVAGWRLEVGGGQYSYLSFWCVGHFLFLQTYILKYPHTCIHTYALCCLQEKTSHVNFLLFSELFLFFSTQMRYVNSFYFYHSFALLYLLVFFLLFCYWNGIRGVGKITLCHFIIIALH